MRDRLFFYGRSGIIDMTTLETLIVADIDADTQQSTQRNTLVTDPREKCLGIFFWENFWGDTAVGG